jgi:predicted nucleic acid-binding Zn ribbon protein
MSEQPNTKKCKFCGKELPEEAIFCYYCHRELLTRPERPGSETHSKPLNSIILVIVVLIVISMVFFIFFN